MERDKKKAVIAAMLYFSVLALLLKLPSQLVVICCLVILISIVGMIVVYVPEIFRRKGRKIKKERHLVKEILWYLPVWIGSVIFTAVFMKSSANAQAIDGWFDSVLGGAMVLLAPIYEEFFFRYIPRRFLRNDIVYIVVSSVIFAWVHVVGDASLWNMIFYIARPSYYSYRYTKTDDIVVPMVLHEFGNAIAFLLIIL